MNPVHESLEWLKSIDDTKSTNAKASEKACNWAAHYQENSTGASNTMFFSSSSIN